MYYSVDTFDLRISFNIKGKNYYDFKCPYIKNQTTFENLFEIISILFPNEKICPCFKYEIENNRKYFQIDKSKKINEYFNDKYQSYNYRSKELVIKIYNEQYSHDLCKYKKMYLNSKREIIDSYISLSSSYGTKINLTKENQIQQDKINTLNIDISSLTGKTQVLEKNMSSQKQEIMSLTKENITQKNRIDNLFQQKTELEKKIKELEETKDRLNQKIRVLNEENKLLKHSTNKDYDKIDEIWNQKYNTNKQNGKNNNNESKNKFNNNFEEFYDVIIDIKSVKDIKEGWNIKMNEKGEKQYNDYKNQKLIKIGIIGNANKGKSFLLSKISQINLPSGTSIRTEGLSIKYPELEGNENRKIVLLDSAGLETPVLRDQEYKKNSNKIKEYFKEKSKEKLITELFLQNYIINNSDILILVVGILTYSEQKLINRIKTEIQKNKKIKKDLYIIHNLSTYTSTNQVEDYLNNFLLNSVTFELEEGHKTSTKKKKEINGKYYYEKIENPKIYHLIFANEGSEAGNYYNEFTLQFIENTYQNVTNPEPFDVIESIKKRFIELSKDFIDNTQNKIELSDFESNEKGEKKIIKLNTDKEITLKRCLIDELGFSNLRNNGFEPTYNYFKIKNEKDGNDEKLIIKIESPGICSINYNTENEGEYKVIKVVGNKKRDKEPEKLEDNIYNNREFGEFSLDIPLKNDDFLLKNENPNISAKNGLITYEFQLDKKTEGKTFEINDE